MKQAQSRLSRLETVSTVQADLPVDLSSSDADLLRVVRAGYEALEGAGSWHEFDLPESELLAMPETDWRVAELLHRIERVRQEKPPA